MMSKLGALLAALIALAPISANAAPPSHGPSSHATGGPLHEAARREGARLATMSHSRAAAPLPAQNRNWVARHPVLVGTLAGAGVGLGFAAASGCESSSDYTCGGIAMFFAGTGAGLGAIGGLVASLVMR
jgi:hypothetical protein